MNEIKDLLGKKYSSFTMTPTGFQVSADDVTVEFKGRNVSCDFAATLVKDEAITSVGVHYYTYGNDLQDFAALTIAQGKRYCAINFYGDL